MAYQIASRRSVGLPVRNWDRDGTKREAFVHYTVTRGKLAGVPWTFARAAGHVRALEQMHRNNGWSSIGYHFVVFQAFFRVNPLIFEGRPFWAVPAAQYRHNAGTIAVVVVATTGEPLLASTERAIAWLVQRFRHIETIGGHRDVVATSCPGDRIYRRIPAITDKAGRNASGLDIRTFRPRGVY